jgi:hypothetical protein
MRQPAPDPRVRTWLPIKPPTCLYIAVDPEGQYFAPANVPQTGWRSWMRSELF